LRANQSSPAAAPIASLAAKIIAPGSARNAGIANSAAVMCFSSVVGATYKNVSLGSHGLAVTDSLTGLHNRRYGMFQLERMLEQLPLDEGSGRDDLAVGQDPRAGRKFDEQGRFEIQVLPGPGILSFMASTSVSQNYRRGIGWDRIDHHIDRADGNHTLFRTEPSIFIAYNCTQLYEVDVPEIVGTYKLDLVVGEERTDVPLQFVRTDGKPVTGSIYYSNATPDDSGFRLWSRSSSRPRWREAKVSFFEGNQRRVVQAHSNDYDVAGWSWVQPDDESATIELQPAASIRGRVVRNDGTPVTGAALGTPFAYDPTEKAGVLPSQPDEGYYPHTNDEGRFEFVGLPAGLPLTVMIDQKDEARNRLLARHYLLQAVELKPGEARDLGDLKIDELRQWKPE